MPRTKLPEVLREIARLEAEHGLRVGNVFHAGDGNLHPLVLYDDRVEGEAERARAARRRDPRRVRRRRRLDHRRARRRDGQGVLDAAALLRGRSRGDAAAAARIRPGRASPIRASSSRRLACAARCRGRTVSILWRGLALQSVSDVAQAVRGGTRRGRPRPERARPGAGARGRRPHVHRRGWAPAVRAASAARQGRPDARARPTRAIRRSAVASPATSTGREVTATGGCAISCWA